MYIQNPEKRKGCVACIRQTSVRNWYKSLKGKAKLQTGLVHVYASFVALAKIAEQNTALGCFGLERERERDLRPPAE